jgi:predicted phosphoribosyltransferase
MLTFENRRDAGRRLADHLRPLVKGERVLVAALPRGGVPVGYEVARAMHAPLEPFIVRKVGAPHHPELAIGAIASGNVRIVNNSVVNSLQILPETLERLFSEEEVELTRRDRLYRRGRAFPDVAGKTVVLVDDGLATGATMLAAVRSMRKLNPRRIIVAAPVGSPDVCARLRVEGDECVCVVSHFPLNSVGEWYDDFEQTTDEEVVSLLAAHNSWLSHPPELTSQELRW